MDPVFLILFVMYLKIFLLNIINDKYGLINGLFILFQ